MSVCCDQSEYSCTLSRNMHVKYFKPCSLHERNISTFLYETCWKQLEPKTTKGCWREKMEMLLRINSLKKVTVFLHHAFVKLVKNTMCAKCHQSNVWPFGPTTTAHSWPWESNVNGDFIRIALHGKRWEWITLSGCDASSHKERALLSCLIKPTVNSCYYVVESKGQKHLPAWEETLYRACQVWTRLYPEVWVRFRGGGGVKSGGPPI